MFYRFWSTIERLNRDYFFDYLVVLFIALVLFTWLQASPTLAEPDSFYHAKMAQFISQGKILKQLPWLQETYLKDNFVDHHFLYHLLLVPGVIFFNPLVGIKISTVIFTSFFVLLIYWFLKKYKIKWPLIFIIVLLTVYPWLFRASLVKAPVVFLSLLLLIFYALTHQRKFLLFIFSFFSVWLYAGWPLILVVGVLYLLATMVVNRLRESQSFYEKLKNFLLRSTKQNNLKAALSGLKIMATGLISGSIINPYFPNNLSFFWQQFVKIAVINYQKVIGVGGEWYPYGFIQLVIDTPIIFAFLLFSLLLFIFTCKKQSIYSWIFGVLSLVFFLLTLKSRRYVELYVPLTMIFTAFCWNDFFKNFSGLKILNEMAKAWRFIFIGLISVIIIGFIFNIPQDLALAKRDLDNGFLLTHYQRAANWLKQNTEAGTIIFQADWDDFPALFYYNDQNYYLTGLDPTFMYQKSPERYQQYVDLTLGQEQLAFGQLIHSKFKADYVFLDKEHQTLANILKFRVDFQLVYEDNESKIYKYLY